MAKPRKPLTSDINWGTITQEQLRQFYEIEKELAAQLRVASKEERLGLYQELYAELFKRVPYHPMLTRKASPTETARAVDMQLRFVKRFLRPDCTYLEIGAGDCAHAFEVAKLVGTVYAVDVSNVLANRSGKPSNLDLVLSQGTNIPVPEGTIDVAYSNQLMEHLHPDDALEQLDNIYRVLAVGGRYICVTPNRLAGPGDVSAFFDDEATGLHLREYTYQDLGELFRQVGFSQISGYVGHQRGGVYVRAPLAMLSRFEKVCSMQVRSKSGPVRRAFMGRLPYRLIQTIRIVGTK
jgi:SAM-dependent methyltransferase